MIGIRVGEIARHELIYAANVVMWSRSLGKHHLAPTIVSINHVVSILHPHFKQGQLLRKRMCLPPMLFISSSVLPSRCFAPTPAFAHASIRNLTHIHRTKLTCRCRRLTISAS